MLPFFTHLPIFILTLILGFFVFLKNRSNKINRYFFYFSLAAALWIISLFFSDTFKMYEPALFWSRFSIIGASLLPYTFLLFVYVFPYQTKEIKIVGKILLFLPTLFFIIFFNTNYNISKVVIHDWGTEAISGDIYYLLLIYFVVYLILCFRKLYLSRKKTSGLLRLQVTYAFWGLGLGFLFGVFTNLIALLIGLTQTSLFGSFSALIMILFIAYAILRYRLMDIRVIIRRSAVFTSLVLLITAIYAILAFILSLVFTDLFGVSSLILNGVVMAILVAIGFEPLKKWLSEVTDSFLFKAEYKPQEVLAEFSDRLSSTLDLGTLTQFITQKSLEVFKCARVSLFLLDKKDSQYKQASLAGQTSPNQIDRIDRNLFVKVFNYFHSQNQEKDIIVREEVRKNNEQLKNKILDALLKELDKYEVNLIVPMYSKEELIGIIFLGDKKSGDVYSTEDIRILEIIAAQSAVAMENAQLFEEQKHFTEHLKIEVDKATKELKVANVQLKKLDAAKSDFIDIASHQLRTPLTVIKGYLSMINQNDFGQVPAKLANPLDRVYKSTDRIIGLVEDLLNVSRVESGRMQFDFEMVNLPDLVKEVFEELEQHGKNQGLDFTYQKPTKKIPELKLDRNKIREVLMNLMDNAIKYTEKGFVKVNLEKLDDHVRFSVSDSGRGIAPDEMPQLFQKFSRAKGVQLMHTEGTGLGLYIAKEILLKHHAKIWAESKGASKGSKFIIEFKI